MGRRQKIKAAADGAMTVVFLLLMPYRLAGAALHEWLGVAMFVLFTAHHLLNISWHQRLFRGKYTPYRTVLLIVDGLLFAGMITSMVTGILLSRYVFAWVSVRAGVLPARKLHMLAAYWDLVLLSVHLGLHGNLAAMWMERRSGGRHKTVRLVCGRILAPAVVLFGTWQFCRERVYDCLFGRTAFVFYDFSVPLPVYMLKYLCMMAGIACLVYGLQKGLLRMGAKRKAKRSSF